MKEKILLMSVFTLSATFAHAFPCSSSGNIHNPDGSVTLKNPVMLRGDQTLPLENFTSAGGCILFGFDSYLDGSYRQSDSSVPGVSVNADGTFNSIINQPALTEITCFNKAGVNNAKSADSIQKNPDNSFTVYNPKMLRGDQVLPLENFTSAGGCILFGFDSYLDGSYKQSASTVAGVSVNGDGTFNSIINQPALTEITCFNKADIKIAKSADSVRKNPDNSFTIYNPKMLRGDQTLPLENFTSAGGCILFGFDSYLDGSYKQSASAETGVAVNADGTFTSIINQPALTEITCFQSGNLRNVGEAGNVIYISGQRQDPNSFQRDGITLKNLN